MSRCAACNERLDRDELLAEQDNGEPEDLCGSCLQGTLSEIKDYTNGESQGVLDE